MTASNQISGESLRGKRVYWIALSSGRTHVGHTEDSPYKLLECQQTFFAKGHILSKYRWEKSKESTKPFTCFWDLLCYGWICFAVWIRKEISASPHQHSRDFDDIASNHQSRKKDSFLREPFLIRPNRMWNWIGRERNKEPDAVPCHIIFTLWVCHSTPCWIQIQYTTHLPIYHQYVAATREERTQA